MTNLTQSTKEFKPEVMKRAAEIAYPEYEWRLGHNFASHFSDQQEKIPVGWLKGSFIYFKLFSNDTDWVNLREGLEMKGVHIRCDSAREEY